jgi:predicted metal-dependent peptidase
MEVVDKAVSWLLQAHPWWANCLLQLKLVETNQYSTAATDGVRLYYNPDFFQKLTFKEVVAVLAHEVAHCVLLHVPRRGPRQRYRWNVAADMSANALLVEDGFTLPAGTVPPGDLSKTTEQNYHNLPDMPDVVISLDVLDPSNSCDSTPEELEARWREIRSMLAGIEPGSIKRALDVATTKKVDWKQVLWRFASQSKKDPDTTWRRPSRRHGFPGRLKIPEPLLAVCIDVSGSISDEDLKEVIGQIDLLRQFYSKCILIFCDAAVSNVIELENYDPFPDSVTGGGGTDFNPALEKAVTFNPDCILYFTDGYAPDPNPVNIPVLWILPTGNPSPTWGEAVFVGDK